MVSRTLLCAVFVCAYLAGCSTQQPSAPRDTDRLGAGTLDPAAFQMRNGRVISQTGVNTAIVETSGLPYGFSRQSEVLREARKWCGGSVQITRIARDGTRLATREQFLIRCR